MGSASREALAQAQATLTKLGKKVSAAVGSELLDASGIIEGSSSLRAAVADAVVPSESKQKLMAQVFVAASQPTRVILDAVAAHRWSHPDDIVAAIENLGIRAEAMVSGSGLDDELLAMSDVIGSDPELELTLGSKLGDSEAKAALVRNLFAKKASAPAVRIVEHLVRHARGRRIGAMLTEAAKVVADQYGFDLATITVATELKKQAASRLEKTLTTSYGRPIKLNTVIDPSILGGMRIQIGNDVIDGSVAARLNELRTQLAS